jgi:hypothetical protein
MHLQSAVVMDEAKLSESVHEEVYSRAGCTDHFRQSSLAHFWDHSLRIAFFSEASE